MQDIARCYFDVILDQQIVGVLTPNHRRDRILYYGHPFDTKSCFRSASAHCLTAVVWLLQVEV